MLYVKHPKQHLKLNSQKTLSNTELELKKSVSYKKACITKFLRTSILKKTCEQLLLGNCHSWLAFLIPSTFCYSNNQIDDFGVSDAIDEISVRGCKLDFRPA